MFMYRLLPLLLLAPRDNVTGGGTGPRTFAHSDEVAHDNDGRTIGEPLSTPTPAIDPTPGSSPATLGLTPLDRRGVATPPTSEATGMEHADEAQARLGQGVAVTQQRQAEATGAVRAARQALDIHNQVTSGNTLANYEARMSAGTLTDRELELWAAWDNDDFDRVAALLTESDDPRHGRTAQPSAPGVASKHRLLNSMEPVFGSEAELNTYVNVTLKLAKRQGRAVAYIPFGVQSVRMARAGEETEASRLARAGGPAVVRTVAMLRAAGYQPSWDRHAGHIAVPLRQAATDVTILDRFEKAAVALRGQGQPALYLDENQVAEMHQMLDSVGGTSGVVEPAGSASAPRTYSGAVRFLDDDGIPKQVADLRVVGRYQGVLLVTRST